MKTATTPDAGLLDALDDTLRASGPSAVLDRLVGEMEGRDDPRPLLDALLLRARHEIGLPALHAGSLADIPEPARSRYEDRYVEALRHVGKKLLAKGALAQAWPYFRAIGEPAPIVEALDAFDPARGGDALESVIDVAFNQGASPRRGFELILMHYGVCSAITAFESLPAEESIRVACAGSLIRTLHEHLSHSLRADIAGRETVTPPDVATIAELIHGRAWLFDDDAYHLDVSHLASVVRLAPMASDPEILRLAVALAEYGGHLSEKHRYDGEPPFEDLYGDHAVYLRAPIGRDEDAAIAHFAAKLPPPDPDGDGDTVPAQVLVRLLVRLGRLDEAIAVSAEHLATVPESALGVPGLSQLCGLAGRTDRLAEVARSQGDAVRYVAAILPPA